MRKEKYELPKPVPANKDLPCGPECENYVGEDDFDVVAREEGAAMRRAFQSSKGLDVVGTVFSVAKALASRTKGRTEKKSEPLFELPPGKKLRLRRRKGGKSK